MFKIPLKVDIPPELYECQWGRFVDYRGIRYNAKKMEPKRYVEFLRHCIRFHPETPPKLGPTQPLTQSLASCWC